jgi:hypothetical protein
MRNLGDGDVGISQQAYDGLSGGETHRITSRQAMAMPSYRRSLRRGGHCFFRANPTDRRLSF